MANNALQGMRFRATLKAIVRGNGFKKRVHKILASAVTVPSPINPLEVRHE